MALRIFETEDARYYLGLGSHKTSSAPIFEDVDFSKLDMFIFEDAGEQWVLKGIDYDIQYLGLYNRINKENPEMSLYGVDVSHGAIGCLVDFGVLVLGYMLARGSYKKIKRDDISRRGFIKCIGGIVGGAFVMGTPLLSVHFSGSKEDSPIFVGTNNLFTSLLPTPIGGFRNAVTAKKVSEYLVPRHKKQNSKVEVALLYGAGHSGIETELLHPSLSDITLGLYDKLDYGTKGELNEVRELKRVNGIEKVIYHDCGLF